MKRESKMQLREPSDHDTSMSMTEGEKRKHWEMF